VCIFPDYWVDIVDVYTTALALALKRKLFGSEQSMADELLTSETDFSSNLISEESFFGFMAFSRASQAVTQRA